MKVSHCPVDNRLQFEGVCEKLHNSQQCGKYPGDNNTGEDERDCRYSFSRQGKEITEPDCRQAENKCCRLEGKERENEGDGSPECGP